VCARRPEYGVKSRVLAGERIANIRLRYFFEDQ